jgi:O-antigen/teichoic acid export membrane protein
VGRLLRPALQYGVKSYTANLLTFFNYRLDSFLVNAFSGVGAVGLYSTSVSTAEILYYLPNAVSGALFPKVAGMDPETASALTARLARIVLAVLLPAAALFGWAGTWLIPGIFGKPFQSAVQAFLLLLPGIVGIALSKILSADLSGRGKPQYASYTALITLGVTISLDLLLIPRWGINGAAVASSVAYLSSAALSALWFCSTTGTRLRQLLIPTVADVELVIRQARIQLRRV